MNILIAFLIFFGLYVALGVSHGDDRRVAGRARPAPSNGGACCRATDRLGRRQARERADRSATQIATHRCAGKQVAGCRAATPAHVVVRRDGAQKTLTIDPKYDPSRRRMRLGFGFGSTNEAVGPVDAAGRSAHVDVGRVDRDRRPRSRRSSTTPRRASRSPASSAPTSTRAQAIKFDWARALYVLAIISLSLALINLFPFLPLDGGHIFWAVAEKVRGRAIPFAVMERASVVGFVLIVFLFVIGLSNDIGRLTGEGFQVAIGRRGGRFLPMSTSTPPKQAKHARTIAEAFRITASAHDDKVAIRTRDGSVE